MENSDSQPLYYADYIELDKILSAQHPRSFELPQRADDELLFIIIHQAYELWFKQILFELDVVRDIFAQEHINDNSPDMSRVIYKLKRVVKILELLIQQVQVLETMTPLDFLDFRDLLVPASGFQSNQFRLIEAKLGLKMEQRHLSKYYKNTRRGGLSEIDLAALEKVESEPTLKDAILKWLERMPFFDAAYWQDYQPSYPPDAHGRHPFWSDYKQAYQASLTAKESGGLTAFDEVFFEKGLGNFSATAIQAGLFIMLYRNLPVFHQPFELLNSLTEIDELLSDWRYRHLLMVRRMIGLRVGTGGTSGAGYLEGALSKHYAFRELNEMATFLMERNRLPHLPPALTDKLGFNA